MHYENDIKNISINLSLFILYKPIIYFLFSSKKYNIISYIVSDFILNFFSQHNIKVNLIFFKL
jgi:hypothetical protein